MLKAILFDMDGVLIDSETEYYNLQLKVGREFGIEFDAPSLKKYMGVSTADTWIDLKRQYGLKEDAAVLADRELKYMDEHYAHGDLHAIKASIELLKRCKDFGLLAAIATTTPEVNARLVAQRLGLLPYVGAIAAGSMVKAAKPQPDIFLLAADMLGVCQDECLVIEDSSSGLKAAKSAKMAAVVLAPHGELFDTSAADMVIKSCSELDLETLKQIHNSSIGGQF